MRIRRIIPSALAVVMLGFAALPAETITEFRHWTASWIACADAPVRDAGVSHFRKRLALESVPAHFIVHVSGDSQFLLYVNQQRVGSGAARGDLAHWRFVLCATVWNFGKHSALGKLEG